MIQTFPQLEALEVLLHRHAAGRDLPRHVPQLRLADALASGHDPLRLIQYFAGLGTKITNQEDLLAACTDPGEEEIDAFRVEEGIAVYLVTDGQWAVFTR